MKTPISVIHLLLLSFIGSAQSSTAFHNLGSVTIHLKNPDDLPLPTNMFSSFEVLDERPDTARIGVHMYVPTFGWNHPKQLVFHRPASLELAGYLNAHFSRPGAPYKALIVLRDLWLSDANYIREDMVRDPDKLHERTHIRLKAEIYATKDSVFIPVMRYDTTEIYKKDNRYTGASYYFIWDHDLAIVLNDMALRAIDLMTAKTGSTRRVSIDDIRSFNHTRFETPISTSTTLTPGVYTSFDEFRNNAPSIRHFEVRKDNRELVLYITEPGGQSYYSHDAWGYCDGKDIYVMRDGALTRAWREGNAFYFISGVYREVVVPPGSVGIGRPAVPDPSTGQNYNPGNTVGDGQSMEAKVRAILMIDMDSGAVY
jgi:hypothetical protein